MVMVGHVCPPCSLASVMVVMATSFKRTYGSMPAFQDCCLQYPLPRSRPLLTRASAGDTLNTQRQVWLCLVGLTAPFFRTCCTQSFICTSLVGMRFGSKFNFSSPTILLGLLCCWTWDIFFWWNPLFSC